MLLLESDLNDLLFLGHFGKPVFGFAAVWVGAHGAPHEKLGVDPRPLGQMFVDELGDGLNEDGVVVGGGAPGDPLSPDLLADVVGVLDVQLVEGLDVLVDKCDGDQHQVLLSSFHQL